MHVQVQAILAADQRKFAAEVTVELQAFEWIIARNKCPFTRPQGGLLRRLFG